MKPAWRQRWSWNGRLQGFLIDTGYKKASVALALEGLAVYVQALLRFKLLDHGDKTTHPSAHIFEAARHSIDTFFAMQGDASNRI